MKFQYFCSSNLLYLNRKFDFHDLYKFIWYRLFILFWKKKLEIHVTRMRNLKCLNLAIITHWIRPTCIGKLCHKLKYCYFCFRSLIVLNCSIWWWCWKMNGCNKIFKWGIGFYFLDVLKIIYVNVFDKIIDYYKIFIFVLHSFCRIRICLMI